MDRQNPRIHVAIASLILTICAAAALYPSSGGSRLPEEGFIQHQNLTYSYVTVPVPSNGSQSGPVTWANISGFQFRIWPELSSPWEVYLQGTGREPSGIILAFVVFSNNSSIGGNPPPTNESVRSWYSPDGTFGVVLMSYTFDSFNVRLLVANPMISYDGMNATLSPEPPHADENSIMNWTNVSWDGYAFDMGIVGSYSPAGPSLRTTVVATNGSSLSLNIWDGPLTACSIVGSTPLDILQGASCLETSGWNHSIALLWNGWLNVTLMVRS